MNDKDSIVVYPEYFKGYKIAKNNITRWHLMLDSVKRKAIVNHYLETYSLDN